MNEVHTNNPAFFPDGIDNAKTTTTTNDSLSRAEQKALGAYPGRDVESLEKQTIYEMGYEQAEKDLALTWKDMNKINHIIQAVIKETPNYSYRDVKDFFGEVLRRFNETRK